MREPLAFGHEKITSKPFFFLLFNHLCLCGPACGFLVSEEEATLFVDIPINGTTTTTYSASETYNPEQNDTIKELRKKISTYEPSNDEIKEED